MTTISTLALSFGEGIALILSPCILPVLPLMLGASLDGRKTRPLGIITGFVLAFTAFALISRQAILASGVDAEIIRNISLALLALFGLIMLFPQLSDKWGSVFQRFGNSGDNIAGRFQGNGFFSGLGIGALIGVVWTPCAGPILGAAILQIIQAESETEALATIGAFALGAGIPMFFIALSGRYIMDRLGFLKRHSYAIRRTIGAIMLAVAIVIYSGFDLKLVAWQAQAEAKAEMTKGVKDALDNPVPAPEISGITNWINSDPLTLQSLRGKVVLIDFWTYSCINCIRTLPHLTAWYDKYKDDGFVIIGVHAPEFPFEKKLKNVQDAVTEYGIHYPVALDNDFTTWRAFENRYWPAHYLIDREGRVVYTHFGEGNYDVTEGNIRALLGVGGKSVSEDGDHGVLSGQSPETYLGYARTENFKSPENTKDSLGNYTYPADLDRDEWALSGLWTIGPEKIIAGENAALKYKFRAGKVFLVLGSKNTQPIDVDVFVDGKAYKTVTVTGEKLYTLVDGEPQTAMLEIKPKRAGLEAYAFTFGK